MVGSAFGWYRQWAWFDELIHVGFGFAAALAAGLWLKGTILTGWSDRPGQVVAVLVLIALGFGAAWEVLEFGYDHLSGPRNAIAGKFDTIMDLLCDTGGALIAAVWLVASWRG